MGKRRGTGVNTTQISDEYTSRISHQLTLAAIALRVTIMMGQTGLYLETRRAVVPLTFVRISRYIGL